MAQKRHPKIQLEEVAKSSDNKFEVEGEDEDEDNNDKNENKNNHFEFAANSSAIVSWTAWIANQAFENPLKLQMDASKALVEWSILDTVHKKHFAKLNAFHNLPKDACDHASWKLTVNLDEVNSKDALSPTHTVNFSSVCLSFVANAHLLKLQKQTHH